MNKPRILIVDDKEENRYLLRALLQGHGYEVAVAAHGAEALDAARKQPPGLIISDVLMPVMDGFALCREWKKDARLARIPFVFYTATYTDERDRLFGLSLGSSGSEQSFELHEIFPDPFNGALWAGPPFSNPIWRSATEARQAGSPEWLPVFGDSSMIRFSRPIVIL